MRLDEISDGQRALITLYALIHLTEGQRHTLFLDEPDNYVALPEIQPWLMALADACGEVVSQVVVCSHHPELIDYLGGDSGLLLQREKSGVVTARKPEYGWLGYDANAAEPIVDPDGKKGKKSKKKSRKGKKKEGRSEGGLKLSELIARGWTG